MEDRKLVWRTVVDDLQDVVLESYLVENLLDYLKGVAGDL